MRAKARQLQAEAKRIFDAILAEKREATEDENVAHDTKLTEAEALLLKAEEIDAREKRINDLDKRLSESQGRVSDPLPHQDPANTRGATHAYSLLKALRQGGSTGRGDYLDGIELETHLELLKRRNEGGHAVGGVLIPWDLPVDRARAGTFAAGAGLERRDLTTVTGIGAVINATLPTMIELLRNATLFNKLGARTMVDMQGNFTIPRQSGAGTGYWIDPESQTVTKSAQTIDGVTFSPRTLGAQTVYSRAFLSQTSVDAEMFVREDLTLVIAIELDRAGFAGSGVGRIPLGILADTNVGVEAIGVNGGPITWSNIVSLERDVEIQNALNGSLAYVTSPSGRYKMKTTVKDSNTAAKYLWDVDTNQVNGYTPHSSNQIPANLTKGTGTALTALIFGDFTQAIFAFWGGLDTIVNPYTNSASGAVEITLLQDADFHTRHPKSFAVCKDLNPA